MMKNKPMNLLDFQLKTVKHVHEGYLSYEPYKNLYSYNSELPDIEPGEPKPYLHRIKAVTGAGKTPILAKLSSLLEPCIILWTTPKTAVITQTKANLEGKYAHLLAPNSEVFDLSELSPSDWESIRGKKKGVTILVSTVASYNQKGDRLKLHQKDDTDLTRWEQLKTPEFGGKRQRPLFVFYDEGHNVTLNQFSRLLELRPQGLFLASASNPSKDLEILLPGESSKDKEKIFNEQRTTIVNTKDVVEANLLKRGVEIYDLNVDWQEILVQAQKKLSDLQKIGEDESPIACFIVSRTEKGIDVWQELINQGVQGEKIAVHLSKASDVAREKFGGQIPNSFYDTYADNLTPEDLRERQYTHLIWNLVLKEGWDEPWAYVAYIHDEQNSVADIEQKIGRFIRNPHKDKNGTPIPFTNPDLNKSYFFFNCKNEIFSDILTELKSHLETRGFDTLRVRDINDTKPSEEVPPTSKVELPHLAIYPETDRIKMELLERIIKPSPEECKSSGRLRKESLDLDSMEVSDYFERLDKAMQVPSSQMIRYFLESRDNRILKSTGSIGGWLDPNIWDDPKLDFSLSYGSPAQKQLKKACDEFCECIDEFLRLDIDDADEAYTITPYKMNNPNGGDTNYSKLTHKVYSFKNSVHPKYNGFNEFELRFAKELDSSEFKWLRNPAKTGYSIPLLKPAGNSKSFYPDFIAWTKDGIIFLETKGEHLLNDAMQGKLISLDGIRSLPKTFKIFLIASTGVDVVDNTSGKLRENSANFSLLYRDTHANYRHKNFNALDELVRYLGSSFS